MATVLFSYSHRDEQLRDELAAHLASLRREGLIEAWHDRRIVAGQPIDATIAAHLEAADIILVLVSSDFMNSDYCYEIEMRRAMERQESSEAIVIPVILRPCEWRGAPFGRLLAAPKDGKAVTTWQNHDEAFHDVTQSVRAAIERLQQTRGRQAEPRPGSSQPSIGPRSANVRVPSSFSDKDKDDFLHEAFTYIVEFFENSLGALERENRAISSTFRRLDATRFTAVAYREGRAASRCTIWMGGRHSFAGGIGYVENDSGETNSFNESLTVETDGDSLFLKSLGMAFVGQGHRPERMTVEAAADYLWELFLRRLRERA